MTALLLGWSNVIALNIFIAIVIFLAQSNPVNSFTALANGIISTNNCFGASQKYPDNLEKAAELAVSSLQVGC